ncbi:hypothetical protein BCY86_01845 [Pajaroellobacter abortibovis]|uniref:Amine oxidase domain-containing protein n=1 Tax=Pajaroellobacter abortibovis TaxID=1882918 RepID=A0A1L6MZA8_9BACT|nr:hypothetical protein BCY86_01845 [Pajaroellobacter abortibovis]
MPFRIFESQSYPGGHAITLEEHGFRFDRTGHLLHLKNPEMRKLALEWIEGECLQIKRNSRIWSHGTYTRYPFQANTYGLPPDIAQECLLGFIKTLLEKKQEQPTNFEEFCHLHFGEGFSKHFMIPYNRRLWGVHPKEITAEWCQRFVPIPKVEDVIAGAVGLQHQELGYNANFLYPKEGIGELTKGMARTLPEIEYMRAPYKIDFRQKILFFEDEQVRYQVLIATLPLPVLGKLLDHSTPEIIQANQQLRWNGLYYLDVATSCPSGNDYHWIYVPEEKYPFYRIGCYSHFSPALAPPGHACFYVELVNREEPNLDQLTPQVIQGMIEMKLIQSPNDIHFVRPRKIDYAYVIFNHAYFPALRVLHPFYEEHAILARGRYGGWNYSSMEDALLFGQEAAQKAKTLLSL